MSQQPQPQFGTITFEIWKWSATHRKMILHRSFTLPVKRTAKRFIAHRGAMRVSHQFDLDGKCVVNQGIHYTYRVLPETFSPDGGGD